VVAVNIEKERERFNSEGNRWEGWWCKAEDLLAGAQCLRQHTPFLDVPCVEGFPNMEQFRLHW